MGFTQNKNMKEEMPVPGQKPDEKEPPIEAPKKSSPETYVAGPDGVLIKVSNQKDKDALAESWREQ